MSEFHSVYELPPQGIAGAVYHKTTHPSDIFLCLGDGRTFVPLRYFVVGARGDEAFTGPPGPKGDRGERGESGLSGKDGTPFKKPLPVA